MFLNVAYRLTVYKAGVLPVQDEAPVPPSCPEIKICSLLPLATPEATTPTPTSETSLTEILATGFEHFRS